MKHVMLHSKVNCGSDLKNNLNTLTLRFFENCQLDLKDNESFLLAFASGSNEA